MDTDPELMRRRRSLSHSESSEAAVKLALSQDEVPRTLYQWSTDLLPTWAGFMQLMTTLTLLSNNIALCTRNLACTIFWTCVIVMSTIPILVILLLFLEAWIRIEERQTSLAAVVAQCTNLYELNKCETTFYSTASVMQCREWEQCIKEKTLTTLNSTRLLLPVLAEISQEYLLSLVKTVGGAVIQLISGDERMSVSIARILHGG